MEREMQNAQRMAQDLILTRYRKIAKLFVAGRRVPTDSLTIEETTLYGNVLPPAEAYNKFVAGILAGRRVKLEELGAFTPNEAPVVKVRMTLRFLRPVPCIIGSDMKTYGPFQVEDVASVPVENGRILIKQGLAKAVEVP